MTTHVRKVEGSSPGAEYLVEKTENKRKEGGVGPFKKIRKVTTSVA